jgi:hypothetical protein
MAMASSEPTQVLDDLLSTLESRLAQASAAPAIVTTHGDAIGAVLAEPPRATAVVSLRDAPVVDAFRQALTDGLIRVDVVNRLLTLINEVIVRLVP